MKKKTTEPVALIVACPCPEENVSKHGIIELDSSGKVTSFLEKPKPTETSSRLQSPCFYILDTLCLTCVDMLDRFDIWKLTFYRFYIFDIWYLRGFPSGQIFDISWVKEQQVKHSVYLMSKLTKAETHPFICQGSFIGKKVGNRRN